MTGHATPTARETYFTARDDLNEAADCARCEKDKAWLFKNSPIIRFLKSEIDLLGPVDGSASITEKNVRCRRCTTRQSGGFDQDYGILVCANKLRNRGHLEDTLAHEMVHAYDHMRFQLQPLGLAARGVHGNQSEHAERGVQVDAGVFHAQPVEIDAADAGVCAAAGGAECGGAAGL